MPYTDVEDRANEERAKERADKEDKKLSGAKLSGFLRSKLHNPAAIVIIITLFSIFCSLIVYFFLG